MSSTSCVRGMVVHACLRRAKGRPGGMWGNGIAMEPDIRTGAGAGCAVAGQATRPDRRVATVLFCDIVGSTRFVAAQDPEEASDKLAELLGVMGRHVRRFGGTLCQTLGDGILAVFGAPNALEDHAVRACFAADAIVGEVARRQQHHGAAVRVGIAAGEILWDNSALGGQDRPPAIGRPVHLAAKAQQHARPNTVRLSDAVYALAGDWIDVSAAGPVNLTPTDRAASFELAGLRRRRVRLGEALPMAGREDVLAELSGALDDLAVGKGGFHLLVGDAGMGKSRLAAEVARLAQARDIRVVDWLVPAVRALGAPEPVLELVADLLRADLPPGREGLAVLLEGEGVPGPEALALADMAHPDEASRQGGGGILRLAADGVATLARQAAAVRPLLLVVEDLHWAGTAVQAVLSALATLPGNGLLLILATSRDGAAWLQAPHREHRLAALSRDSAHDLLDRLVGRAAGLGELKRTLVDRAQGNPFFLVESVRSLRADGTLVGVPGALHQAAPLVARVPETVQGLLASRIDALPPGQKTLLLMAAVIGPTFDAELLAALRGRPRVEIAGDLEDLCRGGFIDETRLLPRLEYSFAHALLHESAYGNLTKRDRKTYHSSLVNELAGATFASLQGRNFAVARHALASEMWEIAIEFGSLGVKEYLNASMPQEVVNLVDMMEKAFAGLQPSDHVRQKQIDMCIVKARAHLVMGQQAHALSAVSQAITLAEQVCAPDKRNIALKMKTNILFSSSNLEEVVESIEAFQKVLSTNVRDLRSVFEILAIQVSALTDLDRPAEAIEVARLAMELRDTHRVTTRTDMMMDVTGPLLAHVARSHARLGNRPAALSHIKDAVSFVQDADGVYEKVLVLNFAAEVYFLFGMYREALASVSEAIPLAAKVRFSLIEPLLFAWETLLRTLAGSGPVGGRQAMASLPCMEKPHQSLFDCYALLCDWWASIHCSGGETSNVIEKHLFDAAKRNSYARIRWLAEDPEIRARLARHSPARADVVV